MFEGYLSAQTIDPRAQARVFLAGCIAALVCTTGLAGAWTSSKMSIEAMTPPRIDDPLLMPNVFAPPPPLPPPPRPSIEVPSTGSARGGASPSDKAIAPLDSDPDPFADTVSRVDRDRRGDGSTGSDPQWGPRCAVPPCIGNETAVDPRLGDRGRGPAKQVVARAPLSTLRMRAIYSPDPDREALLRLRTGSGAGRGTSTVMFCVDEGGRIVDVRTSGRFAGQPQVDALCRATVQRWRFRPMLVDGRPTKTCSEVTFDIVFE